MPSMSNVSNVVPVRVGFEPLRVKPWILVDMSRESVKKQTKGPVNQVAQALKVIVEVLKPRLNPEDKIEVYGYGSAHKNPEKDSMIAKLLFPMGKKTSSFSDLESIETAYKKVLVESKKGLNFGKLFGLMESNIISRALGYILDEKMIKKAGVLNIIYVIASKYNEGFPNALKKIRKRIFLSESPNFAIVLLPLFERYEAYKDDNGYTHFLNTYKEKLEPFEDVCTESHVLFPPAGPMTVYPSNSVPGYKFKPARKVGFIIPYQEFADDVGMTRGCVFVATRDALSEFSRTLL